MRIVDAMGRLVRDTVLPPAGQVSVQALLPGWYTLRSADAQGRLMVDKVLVH